MRVDLGRAGPAWATSRAGVASAASGACGIEQTARRRRIGVESRVEQTTRRRRMGLKVASTATSRWRRGGQREVKADAGERASARSRTPRTTRACSPSSLSRARCRPTAHLYPNGRPLDFRRRRPSPVGRSNRSWSRWPRRPHPRRHERRLDTWRRPSRPCRACGRGWAGRETRLVVP